VIFDRVQQTQLYARRARRLLRDRGVLPEVVDERELGGAGHERFFAAGYKQIANVARQLEQYTGATLEGRQALDFGCGRGRMSLPLAERCEHVYGVDVAPAMLREAASNAERMNISNVEWLEVPRLGELAGKYDLTISFWVFQHIPTREGERLFATILDGLRPGGVGALHFALRPGRPLTEMLGVGTVPMPFNPVNLARRFDPKYLYLVLNSYSLVRLGTLLNDAGITDWHVQWHTSRARGMQPYPSAILFFRKD
jgi:SAM-dependent methyltransferase